MIIFSVKFVVYCKRTIYIDNVDNSIVICIYVGNVNGDPIM